MEIKRTKKEQERYERNNAILDEYVRMVQEYPTVKQWRIVRTIGDKFNLSPDSIKYILIQRGAYAPKC